MEATYNVGSDVDVCRMFDQYLYKRNENLDVALSVAHSHVNGYSMNDHTFHTPSFGDEEFDIPPINPHQATPQPAQHHEPHNPNLTYQQLHSQQQQQREYEYQQQQAQHQQQYMDQFSNFMPQSGQMMLMQGQGMMMQQQHQQQQQQQQQGVYLRSPTGASPPIGQETTTTSEDSDDSTPHPAMIAAMKRPSPEPIDVAKVQKKPKVQKKKKKRDPNEPQKPVSAYALFFRDTQAAIKGQNPNASFGEVSKIVASMWDALDADSKNVYKKKTEAAKKEYLKALAIYRASIVSKGTPETEQMYGQYNAYGGGYSGYSPPAGLPSPPNTHNAMPPHQQQQHSHQQHLQQQQMNNMAKKSPLLTNMMNERANGQQQGMLGSPMGHMSAPMQSPGAYIQQQDGLGEVTQGHGSGSGGADPPAPSVAGAGGALGSLCIRDGCTNNAITNPEWEDEYCSNECVVQHCRDVFGNWVAANKQQQQQNTAVN